MKKAKVMMILLLLATAYGTYAYIQSLWAISTTGTIVVEGVEVYWDAEGLQNATEIEWGRLSPGENETVLLYIKNVGNEPSNITLWTSNWSSLEADTYLSVTWNYTGAVIDVMQMIPVEITLHVHPEIVGVHDFSFDVGISIASINW